MTRRIAARSVRACRGISTAAVADQARPRQLACDPGGCRSTGRKRLGAGAKCPFSVQICDYVILVQNVVDYELRM